MTVGQDYPQVERPIELKSLWIPTGISMNCLCEAVPSTPTVSLKEFGQFWGEGRPEIEQRSCAIGAAGWIAKTFPRLRSTESLPDWYIEFRDDIKALPPFSQEVPRLICRQYSMEADPYVHKASEDAPTQQKAQEVEKIVEHVKTAMLTTRHNGGALNSRAMMPASKKAWCSNSSPTTTQKNLKICNMILSGQAKIIEDHEEIKKIWSSSLSAWFGNLGDGKHTGNYDDPRVAAIQIKPTEIRYWNAKSNISQTMDIAKAKITGNAAAPGVLRVITTNELSQLREINGKNV
ncbi:hypothetical protein H4Q26_004222 [Puccinia striiformis f. sp. tritici PST-130]|nr:hypothetical protein H4Q26_004222 [Puccinia striiformis f. sp. tritici PST-130]